MSPTVEVFAELHGAKPFFTDQSDYEKFRIRFGDELRPELDKNRKARQESEALSRERRVY